MPTEGALIGEGLWAVRALKLGDHRFYDLRGSLGDLFSFKCGKRGIPRTLFRFFRVLGFIDLVFFRRSLLFQLDFWNLNGLRLLQRAFKWVRNCCRLDSGHFNFLFFGLNLGLVNLLLFKNFTLRDPYLLCWIR